MALSYIQVRIINNNIMALLNSYFSFSLSLSLSFSLFPFKFFLFSAVATSFTVSPPAVETKPGPSCSAMLPTTPTPRPSTGAVGSGRPKMTGGSGEPSSAMFGGKPHSKSSMVCFLFHYSNWHFRYCIAESFVGQFFTKPRYHGLSK